MEGVCKFRITSSTLDLLRQLKAGKATGVDGISARLLKLTAPGITRGLTHLYLTLVRELVRYLVNGSQLASHLC